MSLNNTVHSDPKQLERSYGQPQLQPGSYSMKQKTVLGSQRTEQKGTAERKARKTEAEIERNKEEPSQAERPGSCGELTFSQRVPEQAAMMLL